MVKVECKNALNASAVSIGVRMGVVEFEPKMHVGILALVDR